MANNDKISTPFIYLRSTGEKIPVTKGQHDAFYKETSRIRDKEQNHGRCVCPYRFIWKCDGDCIDCEYHRASDTLSLMLQRKTAAITYTTWSLMPLRLWRMLSQTVFSSSSSSQDFVNSTQTLISSFSAGSTITKFLTARLQNSLVVNRELLLTR